MALDLSLLNQVAAAQPVESETPDTIPGRTAHIDGDMLAYVAGGGEDMTVATSRGILSRMVDDFAMYSRAEFASLHLTASGCTKGDRVLVPTSQPYQGKRSGSRPKNWEYLRDWMGGYNGPAFKVKTWADREADDGFGLISNTRPNDVIVTRDKDMQMLPGWHLDWATKELFFVANGAYESIHGGKVYGYKWFLLQLLQGDRVDWIRGLGPCSHAPRGCGDKTAEKFLKGTTTAEEGLEVVVALYKDVFGPDWANELAEQAMMLWIRRGKAALLDEFMAFTPFTQADRNTMALACATIKARVALMKKEAEICLSA